jgi:hypothetical protein
MRRDNGMGWAIGAAAVMAGAAVAGLRQPPGRTGSASRRPVFPKHEGYDVVTGRDLEDYYALEDLTAYADLVSEVMWAPFLYVPTEDEISAIQWAADHGYDPAMEILKGITEIPPKRSLSRRPDRTAYLIDPDAIRRVMWVDEVDRIPNLSDNLPIQRLVWAMNDPDGEDYLVGVVLDYITETWGADAGHRVWRLVNDTLEGSYSDDEVRRILQGSTPEEVFNKVVEGGMVIPLLQQTPRIR